MASSLQPCGCVFDPELVDSVHHEEGPTHSLKGAKAVAKEPEAKEEPKDEGSHPVADKFPFKSKKEPK